MSGLLYKVGSTAGEGTSVKTVNQLLAGVHIAAAAEAMAFGARAGLDTRQLYEIITNAAGNSWMFENRVPRMLDEAYSPAKSQLNIFVKDLAIVLGEARDLTFPCPLAAAAHQQFLAGSAAGWGKLDDSSLVKVFEQATGVRVACPELQPGQRRRWPSLSLSETLADLPPVHAREGPLEEIRGLTCRVVLFLFRVFSLSHVLKPWWPHFFNTLTSRIWPSPQIHVRTFTTPKKNRLDVKATHPWSTLLKIIIFDCTVGGLLSSWLSWPPSLCCTDSEDSRDFRTQ